jgi:TPR repeat protein
MGGSGKKASRRASKANKKEKEEATSASSEEPKQQPPQQTKQQPQPPTAMPQPQNTAAHRQAIVSAARQGDPEIQYQLTGRYARGLDGFEVDEPEASTSRSVVFCLSHIFFAISTHEQASSTSKQQNISMIIYEDTGMSFGCVPLREANTWVLKVATGGHLESQLTVARTHENGLHSVVKDVAVAVHW